MVSRCTALRSGGLRPRTTPARGRRRSHVARHCVREGRCRNYRLVRVQAERASRQGGDPLGLGVQCARRSHVAWHCVGEVRLRNRCSERRRTERISRPGGGPQGGARRSDVVRLCCTARRIARGREALVGNRLGGGRPPAVPAFPRCIAMLHDLAGCRRTVASSRQRRRRRRSRWALSWRCCSACFGRWRKAEWAQMRSWWLGGQLVSTTYGCTGSGAQTTLAEAAGDRCSAHSARWRR